MLDTIMILIAINIGMFIIGLGLGYMYGQRYNDGQICESCYNAKCCNHMGKPRGYPGEGCIDFASREDFIRARRCGRTLIDPTPVVKALNKADFERSIMPDPFKEHPIKPETMEMLRNHMRERVRQNDFAGDDEYDRQ